MGGNQCGVSENRAGRTQIPELVGIKSGGRRARTGTNYIILSARVSRVLGVVLKHIFMYVKFCFSYDRKYAPGSGDKAYVCTQWVSF